MSTKPTSKPSLAVPGEITETPDPQGAYPRLSDAQIAALADAGVTDFVAGEYARGDEGPRTRAFLRRLIGELS